MLGDEGWVAKALGPRETPYQPVAGLMLLRKGILQLSTALSGEGLSFPP